MPFFQFILVIAALRPQRTPFGGSLLVLEVADILYIYCVNCSYLNMRFQRSSALLSVLDTAFSHKDIALVLNSFSISVANDVVLEDRISALSV